MIPTILKANTAAQVSLAIADNADIEGKTLTASFCGIVRTFSDLHAGDAPALSFTADETAAFPVGTSKVFFVLSDANGDCYALPWAKIKVTDSPEEYDAANATIQIAPRGALFGTSQLGARWTESDLHNKINEIIRKLGGTVAAFALAALSAFGAGVDVMTAPKGSVWNDAQIVTNVTFDASGLAASATVETNAANIATNTANIETNAARIGAMEIGKADAAKTISVLVTNAEYWAVSDYVVKLRPTGEPLTWYGTDAETYPYTTRYTYQLQGRELGGGAVEWTVVYAKVVRPTYCRTNVVEGTISDEVIDFGNFQLEWTVETEDGEAEVGVVYGDELASATARIAATETQGSNNTARIVALESATNSYLRAEIDPNVPAWAKAAQKPSYTPNEIFTEAENWIGVQGDAGRVVKILAQTSGGAIVGGFRVSASSLNTNNQTTYAYGGVAVKRNGSNEDYLFDNSDKGFARIGDIPTTAAEVGAATPGAVTNIVRELSLGGIWDEALQVWWTPRMSNGSLTYEATTNVNLNAEN